MSISAEVLTLKNAVTHKYLPWLKLFQQRQHLPTAHPAWWQARLERNPQLNDDHFFVLSCQNSVPIGLLPIQLRPVSVSKEDSTALDRIRSLRRFGRQPLAWSVSNHPQSGGGPIGSQPTVTLQTAISELQRAQPHIHHWDISVDPSDPVLGSRIDTVLDYRGCPPERARQSVNGWVFRINSEPSDSVLPLGGFVRDITKANDPALGELQAMLADPNASATLRESNALLDAFGPETEGQGGVEWFHIQTPVEPENRCAARQWITATVDLHTNRTLGNQRQDYQIGSRWLPILLPLPGTSADDLASNPFSGSIQAVTRLVSYFGTRIDGNKPFAVKKLFISKETLRQPNPIHQNRNPPVEKSFFDIENQINALGFSSKENRWMFQKTLHRPMSSIQRIWHGQKIDWSNV